MTYDEAIEQLEAIVAEMESAETLSMDAYKRHVKDAKRLIDFCSRELNTLQNEINEINETDDSSL